MLQFARLCFDMTLTEKRKALLLLYRAALRGDWEIAEKILDKYPNEITYSTHLTLTEDTLLDVATEAGNVGFVELLIKKMSDEDLALRKNENGRALFIAAALGNLQLAKVMMARDKSLALLPDYFPIFMAARMGHRKMVRYLYEATKDQLKDHDYREFVFVSLIKYDMYDVALDMLMADKKLATARDMRNETALHALALKSSMPADRKIPGLRNLISASNKDVERRHLHKIALKLVQHIWDEVVSLGDSDISRFINEPWRLLHAAAAEGNVELLTILIRSYPHVINEINAMGHTIFHVAIIHRKENIFKLIHETGSVKRKAIQYLDDEENSMLHLAAKLPSATSGLDVVPGPAFQLQRELLWFEEVSKVVEPEDLEAKNNQGRTPYDIFLQDHQKFFKEGELWMRATVNSCMVVATLIATVVFAAGFTVPGGNGQANGIPIFFDKIAFKVYATMNALSLILSVTSVLTFLSIMTSRVGFDDFHWSLPNKLMIGLATLFISISTMLAAFIASFFLVFNHGNQHQLWFAVLIAAIASVPVILFIRQHFRLFMDVRKSTYQSRSIFKPKGSLFSDKIVDRKNSFKEKSMPGNSIRLLRRFQNLL